MANKNKRRKITNPFYKDVIKNGIHIHLGPGRPKKGDLTGPTVTKSVRLPVKIWKQLQAQAEREGKTLHAAMRQAALIWLRS